MKKSDAPYLQHILDAIKQLEDYTEDVDYDSYEQSPLLQDGLIRQLAVIGEACNQLYDEFRSTYPNIPWPDIISMRNKLIHEYFGIDLNTVWLVVQEDLPILKKIVLQALE